MNYDESIKSAEQEGEGAVAGTAQAWETTKEKAGEALYTGELYVRANPGASALTILGIGFLLGLLVGWGTSHREPDDYATSSRKFIKRWGRKLNLD